MHVSRLFAASWLCLVAPLRLFAVDLADIPRRIEKEPAFQSETVGYCLLAFGAEANTRVWLVHDGDRLYVDRNGNGDITEPEERVVAAEGSVADDGVYFFKVGDVWDGPLVHKDLTVRFLKLDHLADSDPEAAELLARNPRTRFTMVSVDVEMPGRRGVGLGGRIEQFAVINDVRGFLMFADKPAAAPLIHFGGPWEVTLYGKQRLTIGRQSDVYLGVGTPGIGPGTTAFIGYEELIPEGLGPQVEVAYPAARAGDPPLRELYEIKGRC
jgi:hypothetical protein